MTLNVGDHIIRELKGVRFHKGGKWCGQHIILGRETSDGF